MSVRVINNYLVKPPASEDKKSVVFTEIAKAINEPVQKAATISKARIFLFFLILNYIEGYVMTDPLAWGLRETIAKAQTLTKYIYILNITISLWLSNCELCDCGVTAIGAALADNTVLLVLTTSFISV